MPRRLGDGLLLFRWFKNVSIASKLYFTIGIMALLIGAELFVLWFSLSTLSSLRAYVGGEGLWSKAQKDAVFYLYRYGVSRADQDYTLFQQFMRVPLGDAKARQELTAGSRNAARAGFLEGRNHPDDVDGMISLFVRFRNEYFIHKAIALWGDGQDMMMQLLPIAESLHQEIHRPDPSQDRINRTLTKLDVINEKLTAFEDEFSFTLGEGSRWLERVVVKLLFATALTVEATGLFLVISVSRGLQKGLADIIRAAASFSSGDFGARARILSRDEIGVVAASFNEMAQVLHTRVRDLGQLNQHLRHEVGQRERAEADLRRMNENLEASVAERTGTLTQLVADLRKEARDRQRIEEELRQSQKMEAIGQLTGGIAHDFNNMLAGISGSLELIRYRAAEGRTAEVEPYVQAALTSSARAAALTHRLLAFSRRQTTDPKPTDVNQMVIGMGELWTNTVGPAIGIETRLQAGLWSTLCDPNQLENALLNLVINARDAMPRGGSLMIETANAVFPDHRAECNEPSPPPGEFIATKLTDIGLGMTPSVLAKAFDPFFTTKPPGQGTGLGLSMVYGFVQQTGGQIFLRSKEGQGTTVTIYLPRHLEATTEIADVKVDAALPPPVAPANAVVLVVEDEPDVRMIFVDALNDIGYTVLQADDAASALSIVDAESRIDLLISDVGLPGGTNGRQLVDAVRQRRPDLRVLLITGYADASVFHGGVAGESLQVLTKPFPMTAFVAKVRDIIGS